MTKTGELDPEAVKLRGILTQLVRISNTLHNCAKKGDKPFTGWLYASVIFVTADRWSGQSTCLMATCELVSLVTTPNSS